MPKLYLGTFFTDLLIHLFVIPMKFREFGTTEESLLILSRFVFIKTIKQWIIHSAFENHNREDTWAPFLPTYSSICLSFYFCYTDEFRLCSVFFFFNSSSSLL